MKQWVLSVAGIAILSVLADVILPNGQTRKYTKTVIGIVVTLVIVYPIVDFFSQNKGVQLPTSSNISVQSTYLQYVYGVEDAEIKLQKALEKEGFENPSVCFSTTDNAFLVVLRENFSTESYACVQAVVNSVGCKFPVKFCWAGVQ